MITKIKPSPKSQRSGVFRLEYDEIKKSNKAPPKKRSKTREYYHMNVDYSSSRKEDYLELSHQIINLVETDSELMLSSDGIILGEDNDEKGSFFT